MSQKTCGLRLPDSRGLWRLILYLRRAARCYQENCPHACPSGTFSLPSCLPSLSTEWELKGSRNGRNVTPLTGTCLSSVLKSPEERKGWLASPWTQHPRLYTARFRDASICNSLLSQDYFFNEQA